MVYDEDDVYDDDDDSNHDVVDDDDDDVDTYHVYDYLVVEVLLNESLIS